MLAYIFVAGTVLFTVLGQLILKFGESTLYWPANWSLLEIGRLFWYSMTNWYVITALFSTLLAAVFWLLVVQLMPISRAYPFMSLNYVIVFIVSLLCFGEQASWNSIIGLVLVVLGTIFLGFNHAS